MHGLIKRDKKIRDLLTEYHDLFALDDLELGKTSLVKHSIKLTNETPFKEMYQRIPLHQYEEVKKHLKEMMEIGAIWKLACPWASTVVLVRKKDSSAQVLYRPEEVECKNHKRCIQSSMHIGIFRLSQWSMDFHLT